MSASNRQRPVVVWPEGDLCRRVVLDGVEVEFVRRGGVWSVAGEGRLVSESALMATLGQPNETLGRARGVAAALNADLVRPDQLSGLGHRLGWMKLRSPYRYWHLDVDERDALAVACAHLDSDEAWHFLGWVLAKRLEWPLRWTPWVPPGRHHWTSPVGGVWEFDRAIELRLGDEFFDALSAHRDERFAALVAATDPDADPERLAEIDRIGESRLTDLVAVNPSTPIETLTTLGIHIVSSPDGMWNRLRVLQNPSTPGWLVTQAAVAPVTRQINDGPFNSERIEIVQRVWAVLHPRAPIRLLRELASCPYRVVRAAVGRTERTPARVLEMIAHSLDPHERAGVAANPAAPHGLLGRLSADPRREVRATVAKNRAAGPELLERLAADRVAEVRRAAAANLSTPPGVLRQLCEDPDIAIAAAAADNPATQRTAMGPVAARLASTRRRQARRVAASMPDTPHSVLADLADDPDPSVRIAVAANPAAAVRTLRCLAERAIAERDLDVLGALINNPTVAGDLRDVVAEGCIELSGPPPQRYMTPADRRRWATR